MDAGDPLGWAFALVFLLWLPGFAWTRVLQPAARGLDLALYSIGLSIALVVLVLVLGSYLLAVPITPVHGLWWSLALALAAAAVPASRLAYRRLIAALPKT